MNNNDIIRKIRYTFEYNDDKIIALFANAGLEVTRAQVCNWLKKDDDPELEGLLDVQLATFLNGLIIDKRGKKDDTPPKAEKKINNNIILRKLKIALDLKADDVIEIFDLVKLRITKSELSAFFRNPNQNQYRPCKDQFLRNFLHGMQIKYHDNK